MNTMETCPNCGKPVESGALLGLCADCLLQAGTTTSGSTAERFTPPTPAELAPLFPQLEIIELLGRGGMGAVYRARQKELDRVVALKILPPDIGRDAAFAARFATEARALAKLNHPNIVTIHDFGRTRKGDTLVAPADKNGDTSVAAPELFYFVMEFVDGVSLRQLLNSGRIAPREALAIVPQICDALQYAHDAGIVHRDIKPENILLDRRGRVKVADFGLAKLVGVAPALDPSDPSPPPDLRAQANTTEAGVIMGTPQYMAPEQREHPTDVDHRADIYSLGVVFYQMLTGELPKGDFAAPSKKVLLDIRLDAVVLRALEKTPGLRFQQVSEVKTLVETIATTPPPAAGTNTPQGCSAWLRNMVISRHGNHVVINWPGVAQVFLIVLAIILAGGTLLCALMGAPMDARALFMGAMYALMTTGIILAGARRTPLARLVDLDAPPVPSLGKNGTAAFQSLENSTATPSAGGRITYVLFALLYLGSLVCVAISVQWLPERVATHFGFEGAANGWMTRMGYLVFVAVFPLLLALFFAGIAALIKILPPRFVNIPNRDFWLAPERRATTAILIRHWLAGLLCLLTLFFAGLHVLTIVANRSTPPQLPMDGLLLLVIVFLLSLMIWLTMFLMRFAETRTAEKSVTPPAPATDGRTWAPFQSQLIRDICAHMTEAEKRDATRRGLLFGLWNAGTFFIPCFIILFSSLPTPMSWIYGGAALVIGLAFYPLWLKMQKEFLCTTAWARQQGIRPEQLKRFGCRRTAVVPSLGKNSPPNLQPSLARQAALGSQPSEKPAPAQRFGKLALTLCLGGLALPVLLLAMNLPPQTRLGVLLWFGVIIISSLCEIAAIVLGIMGWKSSAGKAAVIVAAVLPLLAVPGTVLFWFSARATHITAEKTAFENVQRVAIKEHFKALLIAEISAHLRVENIQFNQLVVTLADDLTRADIRLEGLNKKNNLTNVGEAIEGALVAEPTGPGRWDIRGQGQLGSIRFSVSVPVIERMISSATDGAKPRVQVIFAGEREELEKNLRAAFVLCLNERGVSYADVKVSAAQDLATAKVNYSGLQGLKRSDGTQIFGAASGIFDLKVRGESEWAGTLMPGVLIELRPYATATVGLVVDGEGRPIPDVLLRQQDSSWQATTDANGRFPLPVLTNNQQISLTMQAHGFAKRDNVSLFRDSAGWSLQPVRLMMRRTARLSGRVLAPTGKPLAYAPLSLMTCYGPYRDGDRTGGFRSSGSSGTTANALRAITDDQGNWHMEDVPSGCHILYYPWEGPTQDEVEQGRWRALKLSSQEIPLKNICGALVVETRDGQQVEGVVLDLARSTCRITGRVLDQHGQPVAGATVDLFRRVEKDAGTGKITFSAGLTGNAKAYSIPPTDAAGRYEIHNLPPGDWKVLVHQGKAQSEETIRLTSVGEHATLDLRLTEAGRK